MYSPLMAKFVRRTLALLAIAGTLYGVAFGIIRQIESNKERTSNAPAQVAAMVTDVELSVASLKSATFIRHQDFLALQETIDGLPVTQKEIGELRNRLKSNDKDEEQQIKDSLESLETALSDTQQRYDGLQELLSYDLPADLELDSASLSTDDLLLRIEAAKSGSLRSFNKQVTPADTTLTVRENQNPLEAIQPDLNTFISCLETLKSSIVSSASAELIQTNRDTCHDQYITFKVALVRYLLDPVARTDFGTLRNSLANL